jgi:protein O-GlcNAc transferase
MNIDNAIRTAFQDYNKGDFAEAEALCRKILNKKPKSVDTLSLLGMIYYAMKQYDAAIAHIRKALEHDPTNVHLYNNLGTAYKKEGQLDEAIAAYEKALLLNPQYANSHSNLGTALQGKGHLNEAIDAYQKALEINPQYADAYFNLGTAFRAKGQHDEAVTAYQKALQFDPEFVEAYNNLGADCRDRGALHEALGYFQKVLQLRPTFAEAHVNIGNVLVDQGRPDDAEAYFRRALQHRGGFHECYSNLLLSMNYNTRYDPKNVYLEHLAFAKQFAEPMSSHIPRHDNERTPDRRLKIGYVSPNFRRHSVNYFIEPILSAHDHAGYEVFCYSDVLTPDDVTRRIQAYPLHWRDIAGMSDEQVSLLIREDMVDILIDLAGHTERNRMLLFARKPAPIQVSWIGYPNTTGLKTIDYRIVDSYTDPPGTTEQFNTERLVRMPESFLCYLPAQGSPEPGSLPCKENGYITFGSFNIIAKVTPEVVTIWSRVLKKVPGSKLLLKAKSLFDTDAREYLYALFAQQGIAGEQLIFVHHIASHKEHLGMLNTVDIGLDTFPYNGTTTTCEALWMGVPVVTLAGDRHASRVGTSILTNVGLPELIAKTLEEYVEIAVRLANEIKKLQSLRGNLREMLRRSPLCNAGKFITDLEDLYRRMWINWCTSK